MAKHVNDAPFESDHAGPCGHHSVYCRATGPLGARKQRVEHGAAGIGVHLDQSQVGLGKVKVVAEEDAQRAAGSQPCDRGRSGQHLLPKSRQGHHRLDSLHHLRHATQLRCCHEHRHRRKEEWTALSYQCRKAWLPQFRVQGARQRVLVKTQAEARAVEQVDAAAGRRGLQ